MSETKGSGGKRKQVKSQFNFLERASQTLNPYQVIGCLGGGVSGCVSGCV